MWKNTVKKTNKTRAKRFSNKTKQQKTKVSDGMQNDQNNADKMSAKHKG